LFFSRFPPSVLIPEHFPKLVYESYSVHPRSSRPLTMLFLYGFHLPTAFPESVAPVTASRSCFGRIHRFFQFPPPFCTIPLPVPLVLKLRFSFAMACNHLKRFLFPFLRDKVSTFRDVGAHLFLFPSPFFFLFLAFSLPNPLDPFALPLEFQAADCS